MANKSEIRHIWETHVCISTLGRYEYMYIHRCTAPARAHVHVLKTATFGVDRVRVAIVMSATALVCKVLCTQLLLGMRLLMVTVSWNCFEVVEEVCCLV